MLCASCGTECSGEPTQKCSECAGEKLLDGRFELERVLGTGSVGVTYRARDGEDIVAIKELSMRRLNSFKEQEHFEREASILTQLEHPGIPRYREDFIWGFGKHQAFYLVQEYIPGDTLAASMSAQRYSEAGVLKWLKSALKVLRYLHKFTPPVIHRDIKPENLMQRANGQVVLVDFGVVRGDGVGAGTLVGTPGYMAPEQLLGESYPESDVYALGVVVVEMLSRKRGGPLCQSGEWRETLERAGVSAACILVLEGMLEPHHADRSSSKRALRHVRTCIKGDTQELVIRRKRALRHRAESAQQSMVHVAATQQGVVRTAQQGTMQVELNDESLFGIWIALGAVSLMGLPCVALTMGFLNALVALSVVCLVMMVLVPFVSFGDKASHDEETS